MKIRLRCPYCRKRAFSPWRKLCLGPLLPAECRHCGGEVGVAWGPAIVSFLPIPLLLALPMACFVAAYYPEFKDPSPLALAMLLASEDAGFLLGITAMICLYLWWVPLERR